MSARHIAAIALAVFLLARTGILNVPDFGGFDFIKPPGPVVEGKLWLVVVEEASDRPDGLANVERNKGWRDRLESEREVVFRTLNDDAGGVVDDYVQALDGEIPGVLIVQDNGGKVLLSEPLAEPVSTESLESLLAEVGR